MIINIPQRYHGRAVIVNGVLAHHGPLDLFTIGRTYTIDNIPYTVLSVARSQYIPEVTLVTLQEHN